MCPPHLKRNQSTGRCVRKTVYTPPLIDGAPTVNGPFTYVPSTSSSPEILDTYGSTPSMRPSLVPEHSATPYVSVQNPTDLTPEERRSSQSRSSPEKSVSSWMTDGNEMTPGSRKSLSKQKSISLGMGEKRGWIDPNIYQPLSGTENNYANVDYTTIRPNSMSMPSLVPHTPSVTIDSNATMGSNRSTRSVASMNAQSVQRQIDELDDKIDKMSVVHSEIEAKMAEDHQHLAKLDQVVRTGARPDFVLLGYNGVEEGKYEPVFAKTVGQEFHTRALSAIGVNTRSNSPFYFVFRQLIHMRGPEGLPINLYELNQFASFCDHNLTVVVPVRSMAPGKPGSKTGEKLVHSMAKTNGRRVTYDEVTITPSPTTRSVVNDVTATASTSTTSSLSKSSGGRSKRRYKKAPYSRRRFKLF